MKVCGESDNTEDGFLCCDMRCDGINFSKSFNFSQRWSNGPEKGIVLSSVSGTAGPYKVFISILVGCRAMA